HPVFFSLLTRPPTPTLFPYTTLFRSEATRVVDGTLRRPKPNFCNGGTRRRDIDSMMRFGKLRLDRPPVPHTPRGSASPKYLAETDRKSTRLNSSHVSISYAVFCLKKK